MFFAKLRFAAVVTAAVVECLFGEDSLELMDCLLAINEAISQYENYRRACGLCEPDSEAEKLRKELEELKKRLDKLEGGKKDGEEKPKSPYFGPGGPPPAAGGYDPAKGPRKGAKEIGPIPRKPWKPGKGLQKVIDNL